MHQLAAYLKEREGFDSLIIEQGFASYKISGDECYIKDIFVYSDFRKHGFASKIADEVAELAKTKGCKYLTGSVCVLYGEPTVSMKVLLAYGFKITGLVQNGIILRKDL